MLSTQRLDDFDVPEFVPIYVPEPRKSARAHHGAYLCGRNSFSIESALLNSRRRSSYRRLVLRRSDGICRVTRIQDPLRVKR